MSDVVVFPGFLFSVGFQATQVIGHQWFEGVGVDVADKQEGEIARVGKAFSESGEKYVMVDALDGRHVLGQQPGVVVVHDGAQGIVEGVCWIKGCIFKGRMSHTYITLVRLGILTGCRKIQMGQL
ncbi:MAG: hypothetical protein BWY72_01803 [Bacteroidetes bacterium ADurb.Bin416]|nr:MAG: hypothetical protein BWY72_01803 [Bacteroidetes bacterium ADurb.Bin416]